MHINQIDRYTQAMPVADIQALTQGIRSRLNMPHFTYDLINSRQDRRIMSNAPDWINHYFQENHHLNKRLKTDHLSPGFHFVDWAELHDFGVCNARQHFQIPFGFTLLSDSGEGQEMLHFGCERSDYDSDLYRSKMDELKSFVLFFREKVASLKKQMPVLRFSDLPMDYPFSKSVNSPHLLSGGKLKRYYFSDGELYLTRREFEIITELSQGLTLLEISLKLVISARTVESHVENIKLKFGCSTLFQLASTIQRLDVFSLL